MPRVPVQLRMMPKCWFVLLRFWLRVDNTLVRLREARLFCATERPDEVLREVKHSEGAFEELAAAGAPANNVRALARLPACAGPLFCDVEHMQQLGRARMRSGASNFVRFLGGMGCGVWTTMNLLSPKPMCKVG